MKKHVFVVLAMLLWACCQCLALDFKTNSVLSTGKWVKIKLKKTGIYELPYATLREYGFSDPARVKVFGTGGNAESESFQSVFSDDLEQTPVLHENGKIYFYAKGVVAETISRATDVETGEKFIYNSPSTNPYSQYGYYFLTDSEAEQPLYVQEAKMPDNVDVSVWQSSGTAIWTEEKELTNVGSTGKNYLGDNLMPSGTAVYGIPVPQLDKSGSFYANVTVGLLTSGVATVGLSFGTKAFTMSGKNTLSSNIDTDYIEYGVLNVQGKFPAGELSLLSGGRVNLFLKCTSAGYLQKGWVDFVSLSYPAKNVLPADSAQVARFLTLSGANEGVCIAEWSSTMRAWLVDERAASAGKPYTAVSYCLSPDKEGNGLFVPGRAMEWAKFMIFDSSLTQLRPEYAGTVKNQNLHALEVPDMLVITTAPLKEQAERLAEYHRVADGMDVLVLDHNEIFNEFSSGARDAMAYRRICKMFYDRNPEKFQYLLLFGGGTFNNRMLNMDESTDLLLSYQSADSYSQVRSYSTDDFFAMVDDNADGNLLNRKMRFAVGRIPFNSPDDAKAYVDKLIGYMSDKPDKRAAWRNNILLVGEDGDDDVHVDQCELFDRYLRQLYDMNTSKIYLQAFDEEDAIYDKYVDYTSQGQNLILFVGHGNPSSMTKAEWMNMLRAERLHYPHLPIMYISSCDVGRYDNGTNLCAVMLSNPEGGLVSAVSSTRVVYTNLNGKLSNSFASSLAKSEDYYGVKTLGKVLMDAKNNANELTINRLKYHLFGDPALRIVLPAAQVALTTLGDKTLDGNSRFIAKLQQTVPFSGKILKGDGNVDSDFSGTAIFKLYDADDEYTTAKLTPGTGTTRVPTTVMVRGGELVSISVPVKNGTFSGEFTVPGFVQSDAEVLPIRIFAVDNDGNVVSGSNNSLVLDCANAASVSYDLQPPQIEAFYIGSKETFSEGAFVDSDFTVYAEVSDNVCLNTALESVVSSMSLSFDGGNDTRQVYGCYSEGKRAEIEEAVAGMASGLHTAELAVADISGNVSRKTISFYVKDKASAAVSVLVEEKAVSDVATISLSGELHGSEEVILYVEDSNRDIVFKKEIGSSTYEWDVRGSDGERLKEGVYNMYAVVDGIGTPVKKIVVLKQ